MIAQQDYLYYKIKEGRIASNDMALLCFLMGAKEKNTLFDVIIEGKTSNSPANNVKTRVVTCGQIGPNAMIGFGIGNVTYLYGTKTYAALSIIQLQQDEIKGSVLDAVPTLGKTSNLLWANNSGAQAVIATEDGFAYNVTASGGKITGISKSTTTAEAAKTALSLSNVIVLSEEDAANLVGYTITDND